MLLRLYDVTVCMSRVPLRPKQKRDSHSFTPRFPKSKDEGWFLVVGDTEQREVIALKRVG